MDLTNLLVPAMMFFALGLFAQLIRSYLKFPSDLTKALTNLMDDPVADVYPQFRDEF